MFVVASMGPGPGRHAYADGADTRAVQLEDLSMADARGEARFVALVDGIRDELREYSGGAVEPTNIVRLHPDFDFLDIEPIHADGTVIGVAAMGVRRSNGGVRVWRWDLDAGRLVGSRSLGSGFRPLDLEVFENEDGDAVAAVLGRRDGSDAAQVITGPLTAADRTRAHSLGRGFVGSDLEVITRSGTREPFLAVLGTVTSSGGTRVKLLSASDGRTIRSVALGRSVPIDFRVVREPGADEPLLSFLWPKRAGRHVRVITIPAFEPANASERSTVRIRTDATPLRLAPAGDAAAGSTSLAVLMEERLGGRSEVAIVDALGSVDPVPLYFGSAATASDVIMLRGGVSLSGSAAMAVARTLPLADAGQIMVRTLDGRRVRAIPIEPRTAPPRWFTGNRVHGHTRLGLVHPRLGLARGFHETEASERAGEFFAGLGARAFTRHAKSADEDPWWSSEAPVTPPLVSRYERARDNEGVPLADGENPVQGYIEEAWTNGLPMIAYYADSGEQNLAEEHPEWVCRTSAGALARHATKGFYLDLTSGYGDVVRTRLLELADMGASGIYLDFRHMPPNGCWGSRLAADYLAATGETPPAVGNSAAYRRYVRFFADRVAAVLDGWREALEREHPHVQLIVSVTSVPALTRADMSVKLASVASPKSEFRLAVARGQSDSVFERNPGLHRPHDHVRMALGWSLLRDVGDSNPPHVWASLMPNRDHVLAFIAAVTAHGAIAALDVAEALLPPGAALEGAATRADLRAAFELGDAVSDALAGTEIVRWAGLHVSESARDTFGRDAPALWRTLLLPTVGAYEMFSRSALPVKIVTDELLSSGGLDDIELLYVPGPTLLTTGQQEALARFRARGGRVLANDGGDVWDTAGGYAERIEALDASLEAQRLRSPVHADLPEGTHAMAYRAGGPGEPRIVVAVTNRFEFVQNFTLDTIPDPEDIVPATPPMAAGVELFLSNELLAGIDTGDGSWEVGERLSGETLPHRLAPDGLRIMLPAIERLGLVEVRKR